MSGLRDHRRETIRRAVSVVIACVAAAVVAAGFLLLHIASAASIDVREREAARVLGPLGAETATISWTSDEIPMSMRALDQMCVLYLGHANSTVFVLAPRRPKSKTQSARKAATFRIPAGDVALMLTEKKKEC